ncbi:hypothetical protein F4604DRAFT_7407 [Suillus subluteus]|nr:hypothetical protein F4604DRAFT_7407 [Suillus subluteus]
MQLTFVTDLGQSYAVDIDPDMELENVMALLEAERTKHLAQRARTYRSKGYHPGAWCGRARYPPLTQACQRSRARRQTHRTRCRDDETANSWRSATYETITRDTTGNSCGCPVRPHTFRRTPATAT